MFQYRNLFLLIAFVALSFMGNAQDKTKGFSGQWAQRDQASVLLVPYEQKMFLSDVNKEIANRTGLEHDEIKRIFREGTNQMVANEGAGNFSFIDLLNDDGIGNKDDIDLIYNSIQWQYVKVPPPPVEKSKARKWLDKVTQKEAADQEGRGVSVGDGELQTYYDEKQRFMDVVVVNDDLVPYLVDSYDCDYLLFINELDIQVLRDHNRDNGQAWGRMVKVHYSILDREGNSVYASAAYLQYAPNEKDIWQLIRKNLEIPAREIISHIPIQENTQTPAFMTPGVSEK